METEDQANVDHHHDVTFQYYFSKSDLSLQKQVIDIIDSAKETIDVAVYFISKTDIVTHLCSANKRGVKVRVITDKNDENQVDAHQALAHSGIPIKVNTYEGLMHLKNMIMDRKMVTTGSYNFTNRAEKQNQEILIIAENKRIAEEWTEKFNEMWNDDINYIPYHIRGVSRLA